MSERIVKQMIVNYNKAFIESVKKGEGFIINQVDKIVSPNERSIHGIYSPLYGSLISDDNAFKEVYSCKCKYLQGNIYRGEKCPQCGTEVTFIDNNVNVTGWIVFENYYIIQPMMYSMISSFIGDKLFKEILEFDDKGRLDINGHLVPLPEEPLPKGGHFLKMSLDEFYNRFDEVMEYFRVLYSKNNNKMELYEFIMENREKVFTHFFPVYSFLLRPAILDESRNYHSDDINASFNRLLRKSISLNKRILSSDASYSVNMCNLLKAQELINKIHLYMIDQNSGKKGRIRKDILGAQYNMTLRTVITPSKRCKIDECEFPYLGFIELYKPHIINLLCKFDNITIEQAEKKWWYATTHFDPKIYEIMQYILKNTEGGCWVLINRPPTIHYGSTLCIRIIDVKKNYDDVTVSICVQTLNPFAGDFDGDTTSNKVIHDKKLVQVYIDVFNPRSNLMISRNDGKFNNGLNVIDAQAIALNEFMRQSRIRRKKLGVEKIEH